METVITQGKNQHDTFSGFLSLQKQNIRDIRPSLEKKKRKEIVTPTPVSEFPSGKGTINVSKSDGSFGIDQKNLDNPLPPSTFFLY